MSAAADKNKYNQFDHHAPCHSMYSGASWVAGRSYVRFSKYIDTASCMAGFGFQQKCIADKELSEWHPG